MFHGILEDKIANLYWRLVETSGVDPESEDLKYFDEISINSPEEDGFRSTSAVRQWLRNDATVLNLMRGTVFEQDGDFRFKTRNWFSIEPSGEPQMVSLDMVFNQDGFANSRDTHSLVIYYAIATEAKRIGIRRDLISSVVSDALNAIADLERREGLRATELEKIKRLWQEFKNEL